MLLAAAVALAVVPSLPCFRTDAVTFVRFHHWSLLVAGLTLGWILATARMTLR